MRTPIIAGNWKMHNTVEEALALTRAIISTVPHHKTAEVVICPTFTSLYAVGELVKEYPHITLAAQNMHFEEKGAFTGEISPAMLVEVGCKYVILGHSERREYFAETNETVNKKVKAAFAHGLLPIMCVGETLAQREEGQMEAHIRKQVTEVLSELAPELVAQMVIAYEPIWAIGTGKTATAEQANEVCELIRNTVKGSYGQAIAEAIRIQYGGSVKGENSVEILSKPHIDGALVGGAALKADSFMDIIKAVL